MIQEKIRALGLDCCPEIVDPDSFERHAAYAQAYYELRQRKGVLRKDAGKRVREPNIFGPMMVKMGDADAFVSGLTYDYPDVIRPALQIHHTAPGVHACSRCVYHDRQRAYLSLHRCDGQSSIPLPKTWQRSPAWRRTSPASWGWSRAWPCSPSRTLAARRIRSRTRCSKAVELIRSRCPDLPVDGEMQADTAVVPEIIEERYPFSQVKDANVLVFPSLEAANIAYKLLARLGNAQAIGPILLGMGAPVHVLQTGDEVRDIVNIAAVAVMDSMNRIGCD